MSDSTKVVRWQSSALVVAALISTTGAISSALIQTGWFGKGPLVSSHAEHSSPHVVEARAMFTGAIEPLNGFANSAAEPLPVVSQARPTAVPVAYISQPLLSPAPAKASRKSIDWEAIPRFFSGGK